ncbi:unnamed protein product [Eruca vesicaria subsp. sativa]|uniref:Uncharacterized protein n=1 Tax=Eruca vesicaria subsp. sativa TaxID=29727 RepID=A0ABC8LPI3_ERUVS|nr:unnamed protein product [Eruca vesicaria subsp. sativa]
MRTNLRALVAKAYRVRQGRTFSSSSAPNPIDDKGKGSIIIPVWESLNRYATCFTAGYLIRFGLEISALLEAKRKSDELDEEYCRELELYHDEMRQNRSPHGFSEE